MTISLWDHDIPLYDEKIGKLPTLELFPAKNSKACILIIPGGAYSKVARDHEGVQVAQAFNALGISAAVLDYRVAPCKYPVQLLDAKRAMRCTRYFAKKYGYDENKIGVLGFSAGGHLASMLLTLFDEGMSEGDEIDRISCRPNIGILSYAVIDITSSFGHRKSSDNLLGADASTEERTKLSSEYNVKENTPPCFLWHTATDASVPFKNSLIMAEALAEKNIPFEMHIFPNGEHGQGLWKKDEYNSRWFEMAYLFVKKYFGL